MIYMDIQIIPSVRPEIAGVEWSKGAPGLVSRAVLNPSLRHWPQWGGKRAGTSSVSTSLRLQDMLWPPLPFGSRSVP